MGLIQISEQLLGLLSILEYLDESFNLILLLILLDLNVDLIGIPKSILLLLYVVEQALFHVKVRELTRLHCGQMKLDIEGRINLVNHIQEK